MRDDKIKIPRGWRRLRRGTIIKTGDKARWTVPNDKGWVVTSCAGEKVGQTAFTQVIYIRRMQERKSP